MDAESETSVKPQSRWPGLVFSLLVPGFGLFRGRKFRRGVAWIIGLQIVGVIIAFLCVLEFIPIAVALIAVVAGLIAVLWMLRESFCPGKMTPKLWALFFALLLLFALLPAPGSFITRHFKVSTGAMEPTLMGAGGGNTPDHVLVDRVSYLFSRPKRGDLVVFETSGISEISRHPDSGGNYYIKRIVGLPGEQIEIRDGSVFADGMRLGERDGIPSIQYTNNKRTFSTVKKRNGIYFVGDSEYFVLGDNSPNSFDSRFWEYVPDSAVIGKVTKIYFPFARLGAPRFEPSGREQVGDGKPYPVSSRLTSVARFRILPSRPRPRIGLPFLKRSA